MNRNASAASSGLGPSEPVEAQGEEHAGSQSLTTRNGMMGRTQVSVDRAGSFVCLSLIFLHSFLHSIFLFLFTS